jgi:selenocysteine-specific elongation factor
MTDHRHFILGTAGHVDHGKSALVKTLTGTDPDRLPEEKARGITIDLGFAELGLPSPNHNGAQYAIGIVDVPGHEDFVRNMVAGVGAIDAALLVIAADDGWMPQTEEHLQILTYLGVRCAVIALSKIDLVADESAAIAAVRDRLAGTSFADATIVPTSVPHGTGVEALKTAIAAVLSRLPSRRISHPRLAVDRVFALKGIGTVVTGTLTGGTIIRGQPLIVQPAGMITRARTIQSHGHDIAVAVPGSRVALNLPDVQPADEREMSPLTAVGRGDVVTVSATGRPSHRLCVLLTQSQRTLGTSENRKLMPRLKNGLLVYLHHGSAAVPARVRILETASPDPAHQSIAIVKTQSPLLAVARDRFVLRDWSQRHTIAGGIVLDPLARMTSINRHRRAYASAVRNVVNHLDDPVAHLAVRLSRNPIILQDEAMVQTDFTSDEIEAAFARALMTKAVMEAGPLLVEHALWKSLREHLVLQVAQHHASHPEQTGLPLTDLRTTLATLTRRELPTGTATALEQSLFANVASEGIVNANGIIRRSSHHPALPPRLRAAGDALRKRLTDHPLSPPSRKELCGTDIEHQALRFLIATGGAVELSPDIILAAGAYSQALEQIRGYLSHHGSATVTELKSMLSSSRRVMIPLLERLDREGITQRAGDVRRLRR